MIVSDSSPCVFVNVNKSATKRRGRVVSTPSLYSGGLGLNLGPESGSPVNSHFFVGPSCKYRDSV
jgi:hypothetical protein